MTPQTYKTLEELIHACGKGFMNLRKVWNEKGEITNWIAEGDGEPIPFTIAKTPRLAVYKLYLLLKSSGDA